MIARRTFLAALFAGPAIVRAESLMRLYVPPLILYGDGLIDDTEALQAWTNGGKVRDAVSGLLLGGVLSHRTMLISKTIDWSEARNKVLCHNRIITNDADFENRSHWFTSRPVDWVTP